MKVRFFHLPLIALLIAGYAMAQGTFTSGSNGNDGALDYSSKPPGTYNFDPATFGPLPLDASGDNIFNFTLIKIPSGVTVNLTNTLLRGKPVIFLSQGDVIIAGTLVLNGASGADLSSAPAASWMTLRVPTQPGPGGFPGGVGARPATNTLPATPASPGLGPGGAPVQTSSSCSYGGAGSFAAVGYGTPAGSIYGNAWTVPLIGGSGGSGGCVAPSVIAADAAGATGGAGGGAIRIVSTTQITVSGTINAYGGNGGYGRSGGTQGGGGSGGAVNLIAPTITVSGYINATGGYPCCGSVGYIQLNATTYNLTGSSINPPPPSPLKGLLLPPLPAATTVPTVTITSVNNISVAQPPTGAYTTPDVTINAASTVTINISAVAVPIGTVVQLNIQSELGPDQNVSCTPLAGTLAGSTATCTATFPTSVSRILASASW